MSLQSLTAQVFGELARAREPFGAMHRTDPGRFVQTLTGWERTLRHCADAAILCVCWRTAAVATMTFTGVGTHRGRPQRVPHEEPVPEANRSASSCRRRCTETWSILQRPNEI